MSELPRPAGLHRALPERAEPDRLDRRTEAHGGAPTARARELIMEFRLYLLQRLSALIMAPLVIGHIAVMIYAIQGGLTAAEILGRTQGSLLCRGHRAGVV